MNLRNAAERIRVLDMNLLLFYDFASFKKLSHMCCGFDLSLMRAYLMNFRIEWLNASVICIK